MKSTGRAIRTYIIILALGAALASIYALLKASRGDEFWVVILGYVASTCISVAILGFFNIYFKHADVTETLNEYKKTVETEFQQGFSSLENSLRTQNDILIGSLPPGYFAPEDQIKNYQNLFHHYHVTEVPDKKTGDCKYIWRHHIIDYAALKIPNRLFAWRECKNMEGEPNMYSAEGVPGIGCFTQFIKPAKGSEDTQVEVYSGQSVEFDGILAGIALLRTYAKTKIRSPCLLSRKAIEELEDPQKTGDLSDEEGKILEKIWEFHFLSSLDAVLTNPFKKDKTPPDWKKNNKSAPPQ